MRHVFLSYSRRDSDVAFRVYNRLVSEGLNIWMDQRSIRPGASYAEEIYLAIQNAYVVLLLFSATANQSREIHKEIQLASSSQIPIIPLKLENASYHPALGYHLAATQWIEGADDFELALSTLLEQLVRITPPSPKVSGGAVEPTDNGNASSPPTRQEASVIAPPEHVRQEASVIAPPGPTRQDELAAAITAQFPDAVVKHVNTLPWFYIHLPSVNRKYMTHLAFNTAKPGIHFNFYVRDPQFIEGVASRCAALQTTGSGLRLMGNPKFPTVAEAVRAAVDFIRLLEVHGAQQPGR